MAGMAPEAKTPKDDSGGPTSRHVFPTRPAHGGHTFSQGSTFGLRANYFAINGGSAKDVPKGFKLQQIIKQAVGRLRIAENEFASDFKSHLIVLEPIPPENHEFIEVFTNEQGNGKPYSVRFVGETKLIFDDLKKFIDKGTLPVTGANPYTYFAELLDAAGIVLGHKARSNPLVNSQRSGRFFPFGQHAPGQQENLQRTKLMLVRGYFQSIRPAAESSLSPFILNANVAYGVFRQAIQLRNAIPARDFSQGDGNLRDLINLDRQLAKAKIIYTIPAQGSHPVKERNKVMLGLADSHRSARSTGNTRAPRFSGTSRFGGPKQVNFFLDGGGTMSNNLRNWYNQNQNSPWISVYDYFHKQFGKVLDVRLPLVDIGTPQKPIFVPAELCRIKPGQLIALNLDSGSSDAMIKFACKSPAENRNFIESFGRQVLGLGNNQTLLNFGLKVADNLKQVEGRLLSPPIVKYQASKAFADKTGGGWLRPNTGGKVVKKSDNPIVWMCAHIHPTPDNSETQQAVDKAVKSLGNHLENKMGLNISPTYTTIRVPGKTEQEQCRNLMRAFQERKKKNTLPKYLLVVLPNDGPVLYRTIKLMGDVEYGFHTLNLKAGGVNHHLTGNNVPSLIEKGKTMFVGYDVTHPTNFDFDGKKASKSQDPKDEETSVDTKMNSLKLAPHGVHDKRLPPSQVALVASVDKDLGQWPAVTWTNTGNKEMLDEELHGHFQGRLELYYKKNEATLPESVVVYRDGVSEGQYEQVTEIELPRIKKACEDVCKKYKKRPIAITLVVAVKRHQTRFYPGEKSSTDKTGNNKAGTVVDNTITVMSHWDFYLQSHHALKGTARPAHYTVLHDEIFRAQYKDKAADQLEQVTHCISYAFGRATKAVNLCTPAYYADMACTRARKHMWELYEGEHGAHVDQGTIRQRKVHDNLKDSMYYI
ncbi:hypothetical protein PG984_004170 [Apiospora sp. TS-2023a]